MKTGGKTMNTRKQVKKPRIGIYSMGLKHYWGQFPGLRERLIEYGELVVQWMMRDVLTLVNGMVKTYLVLP